MKEGVVMQYVITCHVPMCPFCGGALHNKYDKNIYVCNDCNRAFTVVGLGKAENELICEEIPKEKEKVNV